MTTRLLGSNDSNNDSSNGRNWRRAAPHDSESWKLELPLELRQMGASAGPGQIDDYLGCAADPFFALLKDHRGFGPD